MALSLEDTDKCVSYCRVFTEMGETMLTNIINHDPGEAAVRIILATEKEPFSLGF